MIQISYQKNEPNRDARWVVRQDGNTTTEKLFTLEKGAHGQRKAQLNLALAFAKETYAAEMFEVPGQRGTIWSSEKPAEIKKPVASKNLAPRKPAIRPILVPEEATAFLNRQTTGHEDPSGLPMSKQALKRRLSGD